MQRRSLLTGGAAALAGVLGRKAAAAGPRRPPNFILFLCDDLGAGDIASNLIRTPNIARLMAEGTHLTDFYAPANLCTPSRVGFLPGRYAVRSGLAVGVINPKERTRGLPRSEVTIAQALKPAYATAAVGKWHLGHVPPFWPPTVYGFDLFYGIPYSHDMLPLAIYEAQAGTTTATHPAREEVVYPLLQQRFAARAERFITDSGDKPFFLLLAPSAPHLPNYPAPGFSGRSAAGPYGDAVAEIDDILGRLMALLHDRGLAEDTFVLFTSDNGPWFIGSAGPVRGRKMEPALEGGYRVPCIAWQPGTVPAGRETGAIAMGIDVLPTVLAMAGKPPPAGVKLDGRDLSDLLFKEGASPHEALLLFSGDEVVALRTQRWKFIAASYLGARREAQLAADGFPQLVDIAADTTESYNTAALHPDVVESLRARFQQARAEFA
ncbi:MAG: sulfatase-like hydrolase/transferase, partial [Rhodospirillaceae bacterium]